MRSSRLGLWLLVGFVAGCGAPEGSSPWEYEPQSVELPSLEAKQIAAEDDELSAEQLGPELWLRVEGSVNDMIAAAFRQGVSLAVDPEDLDRTVRVEAAGGRARGVLEALASQLGAEHQVVRRPGGVWFVGKPSGRDLRARVFRIAAESAAEVTELLRTAGTSEAIVKGEGSVVVVKDTVQGIDRMERAFQALSSFGGQFVVEVRFVELTRSGAEAIGVDWAVAGSVAVDASSAASGVSSLGALASLDLSGLLEASATRSDVDLVSLARVHVVSGEDAKMQVGDTFRVPVRSTSPEGTTTTEGFEEVDSGIQLSVGVRPVPGGLLRVWYAPEWSTVTDIQDGVPTLSRRRVSGSAVVQPGGVVVVGGFGRSVDRSQESGLPIIYGRRSRTTERRRMFIVLRVLDARQAEALDLRRREPNGLPGEKGGLGGKALPPNRSASLPQDASGGDADRKSSISHKPTEGSE